MNFGWRGLDGTEQANTDFQTARFTKIAGLIQSSDMEPLVRHMYKLMGCKLRKRRLDGLFQITFPSGTRTVYLSLGKLAALIEPLQKARSVGEQRLPVQVWAVPILTKPSERRGRLSGRLFG